MSADPFSPEALASAPAQPPTKPVAPVLPRFNPQAQRARFALGRLPIGSMNNQEKAYSAHLDALKYAGAVLWWKFEGMKLRLADLTFYTPDFNVMLANGQLEMHEVKGFWQDDARAKIKVAADQFPFQFIAVKVLAKKHGGGWEEERF